MPNMPKDKTQIRSDRIDLLFIVVRFLQVDCNTEIEVARLRQHASIYTLIEYAVAARYFRIVAIVLGQGKEVVGLGPDSQAL